jgi:hypothetical protein
MPQKPLPAAVRAPAGSEPRHQEIPAFRLHAEGMGVTHRAAITGGEDEEENHRRSDRPQDEESYESDGENYRVRHHSRPRELRTSSEPLLDLHPWLYVRDVLLDPLDDNLDAAISD